MTVGREAVGGVVVVVVGVIQIRANRHESLLGNELGHVDHVLDSNNNDGESVRWRVSAMVSRVGWGSLRVQVPDSSPTILAQPQLPCSKQKEGWQRIQGTPRHYGR
jgi:hypothetical protein